VIVVDDCSTDASSSVEARFGARVIRQATNQGAAAARNAGLRAATQPWVAFLYSDDEWLPSHLATVWSLRDGHVLVGASSLLTLVYSPHKRWHGPMSAGPVVIDTPAKRPADRRPRTHPSDRLRGPVRGVVLLPAGMPAVPAPARRSLPIRAVRRLRCALLGCRMHSPDWRERVETVSIACRPARFASRTS
jgi:Glycosyl transferase family 2